MTKKLFLLVSILFAFLFISSFSFAANTTTNPIKDTVNGLTGGAINGTTNLVQDVTGGAANAVNHAANAAGTAGTAGTARTPTAHTAPRALANNAGYTAARTATPGATGIMNNNIITWVILAVAAVIIMSLVWYYAVQDTDRRR